MKVTNFIIRVFVILTTTAALLLFFFVDDYENSALGSTVSVLISGIAILLVTYLPQIFKKRNIEMSKSLYIILLTTILLSMGGGFIFRFYEVFNYYDTVVHFLNGGIIVVIAFVIVRFLANNDKSRLPVMIFIAILVSISLGTVWEIYEFAVDLIIEGSNMQRWGEVGSLIPKPKEGQAALKDTMIDLTVDTLGAILAGLLIYMDYLKGSKFIDKVKLAKIEVEIINE